MDLDAYIDSLPTLDWDDEEGAYLAACDILTALAADKPLLNALLERAIRSPALRAMHECHVFDDKIVLLDALESKGMRIRFRLGKAAHFERVHNHRFDAVHLILRGEYLHTLYQVSAAPDGAIRPDSILPLAVRQEAQGSALLVGHQAFHTTLTEADTLSLLLRGPTRRERAAQYDVAAASARWQEGIANEDAARRAAVQMSDETLLHWQQRLKTLEVL